MHTIVVEGSLRPGECGERTTFHYNSDLSGAVEIVCGGERMRVPGHALIEFIANYVRNERIAELEQQSPRSILELPL